MATQAGYEKSVFAKTSRTNARGEGEQPHVTISAVQFVFVAMVQPLGASTTMQAGDLGMCAAEITMFDDVIVVYKFVADLMFFVTGSQDDNELILQTVLQAFYESVSLLLRYHWCPYQALEPDHSFPCPC